MASGYSPRWKQKMFSYRCFLTNLTFLASNSSANSYSRRQQVGIIVVRFIWAAYHRLALLANKWLCQNNREGGEAQGHLSPCWITGRSIFIYFFQYRFPKLTCTFTAATCQRQSPLISAVENGTIVHQPWQMNYTLKHYRHTVIRLNDCGLSTHSLKHGWICSLCGFFFLYHKSGLTKKLS